MLIQMAPITRRQSEAISACLGLTRLEAEPLPWELLPALGRLPVGCKLGEAECAS